MKKLLPALLLVFGFSLPARATDDPHAGHTMAQTQHASGSGIIKALDSKTSTITLSHEAIPALKWPAMTMPFKLAKPELAKGLSVGQKVNFEIDADGMEGVITAIRPR